MGTRSHARPRRAAASSGSAPGSRRAPLGLGLGLGLALAAAPACFSATFLEGKMCSRDADCGPELECVNGFCGGAVPDDTSTGAPTTGGTTGADPSGAPSTSVASDTDSASSSTLEPTTAALTGDETSTTDAACGCQALDVLLVYDQAASMLPFEDKIIGVLVELYELLQVSFADVCSYHVGLAFTSEVLHNDPACQDIGNLLTRNSSEDCAALYMGGKPFADEGDDLAAALLCLVSAGSTGAQEEQNSRPAMAMQRALEPERNAPGGCNEGFFRPEAALAITFVTAVEDNREAHPLGNGSPGTPNDWFSDIIQHNDFDPNRVGVAAIIPPRQTIPPECAGEPTPRLHDLMDLFVEDNTIIADLCADEQDIVDVFTTNLDTALFANTCSG